MAGEASVQMACEQALAFGPVPSRRLGLSVGANVVPRKTCSYNCVYCQLGRTTRLTVERKEYTETEALVSAVMERLRQSPETEYVTAIGDGEPTLASNLADVFEAVSSEWSGGTALLTNGSLLWDPEVSEAAGMFDVVMPTLSAGDSSVFKSLHRPHGSLSFERYVQGLRDFVDRHREKTWVEVMLVRGLNDDRESLTRIGEMISDMRPAETHITAPLRPPSMRSVQPPARSSIDLALRLIPGAIDFTYPEGADMPYSGDNAIQHLIDVSGTHPLRRDQAISILVGAGRTEREAAESLDSLVGSSALAALKRGRSTYYVRGPGSADPAKVQHV
jgi:wyosine [tRNA(Phe)-imidazoG37] synthetase (radical SAM superfamily)